MSSVASKDQAQSIGRVREDSADHWHPAKISDRKLLDLYYKLVKVKRNSDAFADVEFSPQALARLREFSQRS